MPKLHPLGDKPHFLRTFILVCIIVGVTGVVGVLLGNMGAAVAIPLLIVGILVWKSSDEGEDAKPQDPVAPTYENGLTHMAMLDELVRGKRSWETPLALRDFDTMADQSRELQDAAPAAEPADVVQKAEAEPADVVQKAEAESADAVREASAKPTDVAQKAPTKPASTAPDVLGAPDFYPELLTAQLVALYKKTHDESYQREYKRRLCCLGFTEQEATMMFVFELMILKHEHIEPLASSDYLVSSCFDLKHPLFTQDESWYVDHQRFLCSEITKIWDEACWHYWNSHEREGLSEEVWGEIDRLSRGGKLLVDYLTMMADKSSVDLAKVQAYSAAEQQLLFAYKWNQGREERHPYCKDSNAAAAEGDASHTDAAEPAPSTNAPARKQKKDAAESATTSARPAAPQSPRSPRAKRSKGKRAARGVSRPTPTAQAPVYPPSGRYLICSEETSFVEESVYVYVDLDNHSYTEVTLRESWNSHGTDSHETRSERTLTAEEAIIALRSSYPKVAKMIESAEEERRSGGSPRAVPKATPAAKPVPASKASASSVGRQEASASRAASETTSKRAPESMSESAHKLEPEPTSKHELVTNPEPASTVSAGEPSPSKVDVYFADPEDVSADRYCVRYDHGSFVKEDAYVRADPFRHRYADITERETWNSHGTDSHETRSERSITAEEAIEALERVNADVAGRLRRFERSCVRANTLCEDLVHQEYPGWSIEEVLYNSHNCTLLRVQNENGEESALKISRGDSQDVERLRRFQKVLRDDGGCKNIIELQDIRRVRVVDSKEYVALERMPLLRPAYDIVGGPTTYRGQTNAACADGQDRYDYRVALDIAAALAKMHSLGYVHTDVRPENILVDDKGNFVMGDLSGVREVSEQYQGHLQTSTEFRAPEFARHEPYGTDSDVFAWGRCMLFALLGKPKKVEEPELCVYTIEGNWGGYVKLLRNGAFVGGAHASREKDLLEVALKACSQDRWERYHDGGELLKALKSLT